MKNKISASEIIEILGLVPLQIEGGLFNQSYISNESFSKDHLPIRYGNDKPFGSAIYYLLTSDSDSFSAIHKLPTDEIYHFYLGAPVELLELLPDGRTKVTVLGSDILNGHKVQHVVKQDVWQGSRLEFGGEWALLGTTMAPGYTTEDFILGDREELLDLFPKQRKLIRELTR